MSRSCRFLAPVLFLAAFFLPRSASAQGFSVGLTAPTTTYLASGGSVTLTVNLGYTSAPTALGGSIMLPVGWSLAATGGPNVPNSVPVAGTTTQLDFAYFSIPAASAQFTVTLNYAAGLTGAQTITSSFQYRTPTQNVAPAPIVFAPASGDVLVITGQPQGVVLPAGGTGTLTVTVSASPSATYQWRKNGVALAGATGSSLILVNFQTDDVGSYAVDVTNPSGTVTSAAAVVGMQSTAKVAGSAAVVAGGEDIRHPNGNIYDQVLLTGGSATITSDVSQVTRISFIDLSDDIVQVEYSGPGTLTLVLDNATGPAAPVKYNQAGVTYMKGHASLVITGADENSHVSVFSVGRMTAFDPTGAYDITKAPGTGNDPALNGNPIFKSTETYDGIADIGLISIATTNGKFGGIRVANASFFRATGLTGIYAPGVAVQGPTYLGDISADSTATGTLVFGSTTDVRVTGGDMLQLNNRAVQVDGITQITFTAGTKSGGQTLPAQTNRAVFRKNGVDVTTQIVR